MTDKWLKDIHDKMTGYEVAEPDGLWADIEAGLSSRRTEPTPAVWSWRHWLSVAASLAVVISIGVFLISENDKGLNPTGENPTATNGSVKPETSFLASADKNTTKASSIPAATHPGSLLTKSAPETRQTDSASEENQQDNPAPETTPNTAGHVGEPDGSDEHKTARQTVTATDSQDGPTYIQKKSTNSKKRLSVGLSTSGGINGAKENGKNHDRTISSDPWFINPEEPSEGATLSQSRASNSSGPVSPDIRHHLPLRFGLSVRYDITDRFSIESGLTYSRLTADVTSGNFRFSYSGEQTLHYIGIPLNLLYRLASWRSFEFYASTGILAEKCVSGKITSHESVHGIPQGSTTHNLRERPLQWSANAAAGVQFDITPSIGLYAEPGISYYFDNGSAVRTIYKDRPFNFNLNLGLRFSFGNR